MVAHRPKPKARLLKGGMPPELADKADPVWKSVEAAEAWFDLHGLDLADAEHFHGGSLSLGPLQRHKMGFLAWAVKNEVTNDHGYPHYARMMEMGAAGVGATEESFWADKLESDEYRRVIGVN